MKKLFTLILGAILVCGSMMFAGCDNRETLRMATNAAFTPFEYKVGNEFRGIDIDLAYKIAEKLNMKLEIIDMDFEAVITSVSQGQADIALAGLTVNETRRQHVDFSDTYFKASQYLIVKKDDTRFDDCETAEEVIQKINELGANAKFGFQSGTTGQFFAEGDEDWGFDGFPNAAKVGYANGATAVNDLTLRDTINIVVIDEMPARSLVAANSDKVKLIDIALTEEEYAIAVNKNKTDLLQKINDALKEIIEDGILDEIIEKYYTEIEFD